MNTLYFLNTLDSELIGDSDNSCTSNEPNVSRQTLI